MKKNQDEAPKRAAIYSRVSTQEQAQKDFSSIEVQAERCRKYCEAMEYEIIEIYKEKASGGSMKGRPQLQRLFLSVERDEIDVIVFTKLDRFTRSISDFFLKYNDLEENDVEIVAIDQPEISTDSAMGRVMRNMLLAFAEFEREMIRIRTTEGMRAKLGRGEWRGGPTPLGYVLNEKKLIIEPREAEVVKRIYREYIRGDSSGEIAKRLREEGIRTKLISQKVRGIEFTNQAVLRILRNELYASYFKEPGNKENLIKGIHAPIVKLDIFQRAQLMLSENKRNKNLNRQFKTEALFQGILTCAHHKRKMSPKPVNRSRGKRYIYYRCIHGEKTSASECPIGQISSVEIEVIGVNLIRLLSRNEGLLQAVLKRVSDDNSTEVDQLKSRLKKINDEKSKCTGELLRLGELISEPKFSDIETIANELRIREHKRKHLDIEITSLKEEIEKAKQPISDLDDLRDEYIYFWKLWDKMTFDERRKAIRILVKEVRLKHVSGSRKNKKLEIEFILFNDKNIKSSLPNIVLEGKEKSVRPSKTGGSA